ALVFLGGCSASKDPLGADIREALEVTKTSPEDWEDSPERAYDPKVILRRAEGLYQRKDYLEAVSEYQHFLELHPLHPWADYAQLKLAISHFNQFTTIDRDAGPIRKSIVEFEKLISVYPESRYIEEAEKRIVISRDRLGQHEFYVGRFYYKTKAYLAAIRRLEGLLEGYPGHSLEPDALFYLGRSYAADGDPEKAAAYFDDLLRRFPESLYIEKARRDLSRLETSS
ncbi:MAG TPA: outer membrane protein assembly factor BamD, partial [Nitrospiria bacterium]